MGEHLDPHLSIFVDLSSNHHLDDMDVSKNSGTPKWMVYKGNPY